MHKKNRSIFKNIMYLLRDTYKHYKIVFLFILLETLCSGVIPIIGIYLPKFAVQLTLDKVAFSTAMLSISGFALMYIVIQCINNIALQGKFPFQNNLRSLYTKFLFYKSLDCDYSLIESKQGQTEYEKARSVVSNGNGAANMVILNSTVSLISNIITLFFIFGLIIRLNILINLLLVVLTIINYLANQSANRFERNNRDELSDLQKKLSYTQRSMSDTAGAKDIRIYNGLPNLLIQIKDDIFEKTLKIKRKIQNRYFIINVLSLITVVIRDGIAYIYCIWQVYNGYIQISDFVLYMGAIASFSGWLNGIIANISTLKRENYRFNDLRDFYECTNQLDPESPISISVLTPPLSIEFKNVTFSYNDDSKNILEAISFNVEANENIALVGLNGSGKTTIIKLLCGFYKPDKGEILINGYNTNQFKRSDLFAIISAVFQDTCILPFTVGENISFSIADQNLNCRITQCLEMAGLKKEIFEYEKGLDSHMLKTLYSDGIVLSGGQQQKLLLARALFKNAPILLLDEPTAALDPIAEAEVYNKFNEMTRDKTAIYISHRLSSTRFCDKIFVIEDGKIVECGTHDELMSTDSIYKNMFEIQSQYYKEVE